MEANKLSVGVARFILRGWFVIKLGRGSVLFAAEKNKGGRRRNGVEREEGRVACCQVIY
jgi:hypothetical protein